MSPATARTDRKIRLLIVDDSERVLRGLLDLFDLVDDIEVVAVAANGVEAVTLAEKLAPQVVLMDLAMPMMGGIEATRQIKATDAAVRVLAFTVCAGQERAARKAGAVGLILKDEACEEIVRRVRVVAA